jgi:ABC-type xylose transport system substrate-binding protein
MLGLQYTAKALAHWKAWRPKMYREMKKAGTLNQHAQDASKEAARQVAELMAAGYQKHEAEEVVLPELILLKPEK